jgi:hypothetical protein
MERGWKRIFTSAGVTILNKSLKSNKNCYQLLNSLSVVVCMGSETEVKHSKRFLVGVVDVGLINIVNIKTNRDPFGEIDINTAS